ncbi:hypothetical protein EJ03DRAFT_303162 [Teratosphaeria nubilosa]|uniref:Vacuolar ATPase assembly protein VMA22 n=1 Tax=Teratosphaeria nubilosa TaxID=161662 RepID=A0A6G1KT69_9PEZI|nr:hypothetical protein EJ03DRAFT_303162 [Teratosphaeria nubilosa]
MASSINPSNSNLTPKPDPLTDDLATLHNTLDTLLTHYLTLLHHYQSAQQDLQKHLSSAFFSLAQANFKSPNRSRRYGQDFYDDRMKASRICRFDEDGNGAVELSITNAEPTSPATNSNPKTKTEEPPRQERSPPATPEPETPLGADEKTTRDEDPMHDVKDNLPNCPLDPLRWFGILVPRELRTAQSSFTSALAGTGRGETNSAVMRAANAARAMRELEIEIRRCRKGIRKREMAM